MKIKRLTLLMLFVLITLLGAFSVNTVLAGENEQQSTFQRPILIVNTSFLNIRTGPGAQFTVLVTVSGGTELPVLGLARDDVWYQVSTRAGVGWVNIEFVIPRGDFSNVPYVDTSDLFNEAGSSASAQAAADALDAVTGSGSSSSSNTPSSGSTTTRRTNAREWGVSVIENHPARRNATINSQSPGTAVTNLNIIFTIIDAVSADGILWYLVDDPQLGRIWLESPKTRPRPFGCGVFSTVIFSSEVNPGKGPDGSGSLDRNRTVRVGEEAYLLDARDGQYRIELFDGADGWINAVDAAVRNDEDIFIPYCTEGPVFSPSTTTDSEVTENTDEADSTVRTTRPRYITSPRVIINTSFLNIRSGPGAQYTVVTTLRGGTELDVLGIAPDGVWYLVEGSFGSGWLNNEFVIFRGDGSFLPEVEVTGAVELDVPVVDIFNAISLFAAPDVTLGRIGTISGVQTDITIVARTADFEWLQIDTNIGFGWVLADEVVVRGDLSLVPVVEN